VFLNPFVLCTRLEDTVLTPPHLYYLDHNPCVLSHLSVMGDDNHARMHLRYQVERMCGHLADVASNPTSNETFLPQGPPVLEDGWENAWSPDIPAPIHYPEVTVEARYLFGCGVIPY
jgi:hypothetical protein